MRYCHWKIQFWVLFTSILRYFWCGGLKRRLLQLKERMCDFQLIPDYIRWGDWLKGCHQKRGLCVLFSSFFAISGMEDWLGLGYTAFGRHSYVCLLANYSLFLVQRSCQKILPLEGTLLQDLTKDSATWTGWRRTKRSGEGKINALYGPGNCYLRSRSFP